MFRPPAACSLLAAAAAAALAVLGTVEAGAMAGTAGTQEADAHQVMTAVCGKCHPLERVTSMRRTRSQWEETIESMITTRGAQISDEDFDTILAYLARAYGRVDVNRAPAEDLVEVLDLSTEAAAAIVEYRAQHGPFEDFEALAKVPRLDRDALEKKRDAMSF